MVETATVLTRLSDARDAVLRDCPQLPQEELRIDWDPSVLAGATDEIEPDDPQCFVVRIGGGAKTLPVEKGMGHTTAAIASAVQDYIVDETHRPWPELVDREGRSAVLDVEADDDRAFWVGPGFQSAAVGELLAAAQRQNLKVHGNGQ